MQLIETLTKENFWNEIKTTYPKASKLFCVWIDEYKAHVDWDKLFNARFFRSGEGHVLAPKFHEIPYAMQQGIWLEFVNQTLHKYFEQPEYVYIGDLEEDIKTVFAELETEIDE